MKKKIFAMLMAAAMMLSMAACGNGAEEKETENSAGTEAQAAGGESTLVYGSNDYTRINPAMDEHGEINILIFSGLTSHDGENQVAPGLAKSWDYDEDTLTYTFHLEENVKWHDGEPFTADDVKFTIEAIMDPDNGSENAPNYEDVTAIDVIDDHTIAFTLSAPNVAFLDYMTMAILPKHLLEGEDMQESDFFRHPIGTGPFKYVSYTPGQNLELEKYDGYWQEGVPSLDSVEFKFIADVDTAFVELQAGTIDILKYLTSAQAETLGDDYNIVQGSMNLVHAMYLNSAYEPLSKTEVRQALCYAVDRDAINNFIFGGKSHIIGSHMIPAMSKYYEPEAETVYSYDPEKAKELLADAGYADGFDLEITVPSSYSQHVDSAQIIADELSQVGINVTLNQVEWSTWLQDVYKGGNFQATVIGFDGTLAPSDWLKKYVTDDAKNFMHYSNTEYDDVFNTAYTTVDDDVKVENYKKAQMILAEDAAAVYIEDPANLVAVSKKFGGYTFYPTAAEDMSLLYQVEQ